LIFDPWICRGILKEDKSMDFKTIAAATLIAAFVTPAFAADEYYVVQDAKTKKCTSSTRSPSTPPQRW
jgi:hypothetical protein